MSDYMLLIVSTIFVNNILLMKYLGNCPFLGTSKKLDTALGMAMAVVFVLVLAGAITWITEQLLLKTFGLEYLRTMAFILVIATLVQFVEMFLKKNIPALYAGLGIYLPLFVVIGACFINVNEEYNFVQTLIASFGFAAGFGLALILFSGIRERIMLARVPKPFRDTSIGLVTAGMFSLAFFGFKGMA